MKVRIVYARWASSPLGILWNAVRPLKGVALSAKRRRCLMSHAEARITIENLAHIQATWRLEMIGNETLELSAK